MTDMTDNAKQQKMRRILEQTKRVYLLDARQRSAKLREELTRYREGAVTKSDIAGLMYQHAHALKGVALTVGLEQIHELSEKLIAYSIQQEEAWTEESIDTLVQLLHNLDEAVYQAADALT